MKPAFETERLRVFKTRMQPAHHNLERDVFVAFRTDEDRPMVCATAVIQPTHPFRKGPWVDWLEVTSEYRRQGFASELMTAIETHYGRELETSAGSEDGEAFLKSIEPL